MLFPNIDRETIPEFIISYNLFHKFPPIYIFYNLTVSKESITVIGENSCPIVSQNIFY